MALKWGRTKLTGMISRFAVALGKFISGACDRWCLRRFRLARSKKDCYQIFQLARPQDLKDWQIPSLICCFFIWMLVMARVSLDYVPIRSILLHGRLGVKKFDEHIFQMGGSTTNYHGNPRFLHFLGLSYNPYFGGAVKPSFFIVLGSKGRLVLIVIDFCSWHSLTKVLTCPITLCLPTIWAVCVLATKSWKMDLVVGPRKL